MKACSTRVLAQRWRSTALSAGWSLEQERLRTIAISLSEVVSLDGSLRDEVLRRPLDADPNCSDIAGGWERLHVGVRGGIGRGLVNRSLIQSATTRDCQCVGPVRRTSSGRSRFSVVDGPRRSRLGNNVFELGQTCDVRSHKESEWMLEKMASAFFAGTAARAEGCLQVELR